MENTQTLTVIEQAKYNRSEWLSIFIFTGFAMFFRWSILEVILGNWVIFFSSNLTNIAINFIKETFRAKIKIAPVLKEVLKSTLFLFALLVPLILIPLPQIIGKVSIKIFITFVLKNYWILILTAIIDTIYNMLLRKDKLKSSHPLYQFVPLFLSCCFLFLLRSKVLNPNIFIYFISFFIMFLPFKNPNFDKEDDLDKYWKKKEEELKKNSI